MGPWTSHATGVQWMVTLSELGIRELRERLRAEIEIAVLALGAAIDDAHRDLAARSLDVDALAAHGGGRIVRVVHGGDHQVVRARVEAAVPASVGGVVGAVTGLAGSDRATAARRPAAAVPRTAAAAAGGRAASAAAAPRTTSTGAAASLTACTVRAAAAARERDREKQRCGDTEDLHRFVVSDPRRGSETWQACSVSIYPGWNATRPATPREHIGSPRYHAAHDRGSAVHRNRAHTGRDRQHERDLAVRNADRARLRGDGSGVRRRRPLAYPEHARAHGERARGDRVDWRSRSHHRRHHQRVRGGGARRAARARCGVARRDQEAHGALRPQDGRIEREASGFPARRKRAAEPQRHRARVRDPATTRPRLLPAGRAARNENDVRRAGRTGDSSRWWKSAWSRCGSRRSA